ncbi:hypothetical protein K0M31_008045 [Melipona bicolor]|uniref:Uncharacterized protein n=1 Tax=Melipona bicolor TaxID=60889 RepID=A0AA40GDD5_9HYME|nr:hypothetical protein K0M31_008045 [Melipona bicolor]
MLIEKQPRNTTLCVLAWKRELRFVTACCPLTDSQKAKSPIVTFLGIEKSIVRGRKREAETLGLHYEITQL